ncbi:O-antigen ligase family protein [Planomonospora sp. ID67723]|uniref:O-antigen ligase family protein n=1 Tax=Planomonospora sp. ID67723 TaxID=2738134 RepID=UPI0018C39569|nr:O-antigen ligase family protein [Planomonospora sp. ID67723]MBG0827446.1 O-antigen ligase family protein [Planomonospora sp. ID67723]
MSLTDRFSRRALIAEPPPRADLARTPALVLLTFYSMALLLVPSRLIVGPLGSAGTIAGVIGIGLFCWYVIAWLSPQSTVIHQKQPLRAALGVLLVSVLASYASSMTRQMSGAELNSADIALINTCAWLGIALITADSIAHLDDLDTLRQRIVNAGTAVAGIGILQFFTGVDIVQYVSIPGLTLNGGYVSVGARDEFFRPTSTALHAIELGVVLATLLPLALHGARYAPAGRVFWRWSTVVVIATGMMMSVSRSAVLGGLITMLVLMPSWPKKERRIVYVAILAFLGVMNFVARGLIGTLRNLVTSIGTDSSTTARTDDYSDAWSYFSQTPWFGRGMGTFLPQLYRVFDNQYLVIAVEMGVVGTVTFFALFVTGWILAGSARRATPDLGERHLARSFGASVLVVAFSYGTFDALSFPMIAGLSFLILGCCGALWRLLR